MKQLIEALQIFLKYDNPNHPTHCEHDELSVVGDFHPDKMDEADIVRLDELGFHWNEDGHWSSFKYGSC